MAFLIVILVLCCQFWFGISDPDETCITGYTFMNVTGPKCIKSIMGSFSWNSGMTRCRDVATGEYFSFHDLEEEQFSYDFCVDGGKKCWVGLTDVANEGVFVWSDGTAVNYPPDWLGGAINTDDSQDCLQFTDGEDPNPRLIAEDCSTTASILCQSSFACVPGKYLSAGTCVSCPAGKYSMSITLNGISSCLSCPAGKYGSTTAQTSPMCTADCDPGYFCPSASTTAQAVQCPAGRFGSDPGLSDGGCSGPCAPGHYCLIGSTVSNPSATRCSAGYYGGYGQTVATCSGECQPGYYCPIGSTSPAQVDCGSEDHYCELRSSTFTIASTGHYTLPETGTTRSSQSLCTKGYYCVSGTRRLCPPGSYENNAGSSFCSGICGAGFFCPNGSEFAYSQPCGLAPDPDMYYCPAGTPVRLISPDGYYTQPYGPIDQRSYIALCPTNSICLHGTRTRKIEVYQVPAYGNSQGCAFHNYNDDTRYGWVWVNENTRGSIHMNTSYVSIVGAMTLSAVNIRTVPGCKVPYGIYVDVHDYGNATIMIRTNKTLGPDYETCWYYWVSYTITAGGYSTYCNELDVYIADINDIMISPNNSYSMSIKENSKMSALVGDAIPASDEDMHQNLYFSLTAGNIGEFFKISPCSGQIFLIRTDLNYEQWPRKPHYNLTVKIEDDGVPKLFIFVNALINVLDVNEPPSFNYSDYRINITENSPGFTPTTPSQLTVFDPDETGSLSFSATNYDSDGFSSIPPFIFNASGYFVVNNGVKLNYEFKKQYSVNILLTDGEFSAMSFQKVNVLDANDAPILSAFEFSVPENSAPNIPIGYPITATDEDGGAYVTFSVVSGDSRPDFSISNADSLTGQMYTSSISALDYETKNIYTITIGGTDNGLLPLFPPATGTVTFNITVTDVNEVCTISNQTRNISEAAPLGTEIGNPLSYHEPDSGQVHFFALLDDGNGAFTVDLDPPQLYNQVLLDFESVVRYDVVIRVVDNGNPGLACIGWIQINVTNANEAPWVIADQNFTLVENSPPGTVAAGGNVMGADVDAGDSTTLEYFITGGEYRETTANRTLFIIEQSGVNAGRISIAPGALTSNLWMSDLNFEKKNEFLVQITVRDRGVDGPRLNGTGYVRVKLTDDQEAPRILFQKRSVREQSALGTLLGPGAITGEDQDAGEQGTLTFSLVGTNHGYFNVSSSGVASLIGSPPSPIAPIEENEYNVSIRVIDTTGRVNVSTIIFSVVSFNFDPVVTPFSVSIPESTPLSTVIGTIVASDQNMNQVLSYFIDNWAPPTSSGMVAISSVTAGLSIVGALDFETMPSITLTITAQDNGPGLMTGTNTAVITVTDVNEPPTITSSTFDINENSAINSNVGTVAVYDQDCCETKSFVIVPELPTVGPLPFAIGISTGVITVTGGTNFESFPITVPATNYYNVRCTVTDKGGLTHSKVLKIYINDVNEAPSITSRSYTISEDAPFDESVSPISEAVSASDPDYFSLSHGQLTYSIASGNTNGAFTIDSFGFISLASGKLVDWEDVDTYILTVRVTDNAAGAFLPQLFADAAITITVINVNDVTITGFGGVTVHGGTVGGDSIVIYGTNFGLTNYKIVTLGATQLAIVVKYGGVDGRKYTATGCSITVRNTAITCTTIAGVGITSWRVTSGVDEMPAPSGLTTRYADPVITSLVNANALPTAGGAVVTIQGTNFGPLSEPLIDSQVWYYQPDATTYQPTGCTMTVAHTTIQCTSVVGRGPALSWKVQIGAQTSAPYSGGSSYAPPTITALGGDPITNGSLTQGGELVILTGINFAIVGSPVSARYGYLGNTRLYAAPGCSVTISHTQITCLSAPGIGASLRWIVIVATLESALSTQTLSYRVPIITTVTGPGVRNGSTAGSQRVVIAGQYFGPAVLLTMDSLPMPFVNMSIQYGKPTELFSNWYIGQNCYISNSHSEITCRTAQGTGKGHGWRVTLGDQASTVNQANSAYSPPIVMRFSGPANTKVGGNTPGNDRVILVGSNFGYLDSKIDSVLYGKNETYPEFAAMSCVIRVPHYEIECRTNEGAGIGLRWTVVIDEQKSVEPTTSYAPPRITGYSGAAAMGASTRGGQTIVLLGENFGPSGTEFLNWVRYGPTGNEYEAINCMSVAHLMINCTTVPGSGRNHRWRVSVQDLVNVEDSPLWSFADAVVAELRPNGTSTAGSSITLVGPNFAYSDGFTIRKVYLTGYPFPLSTFSPRNLNDPMNPLWDAVDVAIPEGWGDGKTIQLQMRMISVAFNSSSTPILSNSVSFAYNPPFITNVHTIDNSGETPGTILVQIKGDSFGVDTSIGYVTLEGQIQVPRNWSHTLIILVTTEREGNIVVYTKRTDTPTTLYYASNVKHYVNLSPAFSTSMRNLLTGFVSPTIGGGVLTFQVQNIGDDRNLTKIIVGKSNDISTPSGETIYPLNRNNLCDITNGPNLISNTSNVEEYEITCVVPPGMGDKANAFDVQYGDQSSSDATQPVYLKYAKPVITGVTDQTGMSIIGGYDPMNPFQYNLTFPTTGGCFMLHGNNFGIYGFGDGFTSPDYYSVMPLRPFNQSGAILYTHYNATFCVPPGIVHGFLDSFLSPIPVIHSKLWDLGSPYYFQMSTGQVAGYEFHFTSGFPSAYYFSNIEKATAPQRADLYLLISYMKPSLNSFSMTSGTRGGGNVTITGLNFGASNVKPLPRVTIASRQCALFFDALGRRTEPTPHTLIICKAPVGTGVNQEIQLRIGSSQISGNDYGIVFSYFPPTVTAIFPTHGPTVGRINITINGTNMGEDTSKITVYFFSLSPIAGKDIDPDYVAPPSKVLYANHEMIIVLLPEGMGEAKEVIVEVAGQRSAVQGTGSAPLFEYDPPVLDDISPLTCRTDGCYTNGIRPVPRKFELTGDNFGPPIFRTNGDYFQPVLIGPPVNEFCDVEGSTYAEKATKHSHIKIICTLPGGFNKDINITVTVGRKVSNAQLFSYLAPDLKSVSPNSMDARGSATMNKFIRFNGLNFGNKFAPTVYMGNELVENVTLVTNHTDITGQIPEGTVGAKNITIVVGNQEGFVSEELRLIALECQKDFYGQPGEYCEECPQGAICGELCEKFGMKCTTRCPVVETCNKLKCTNSTDRVCVEYHEPFSMPNWWLEYLSTPNDICPARRQLRPGKYAGSCANFVPCDPPEACIGDNKCAKGYKPLSYRCSLCDKGFYRYDGECIKCPDRAWLLILFFVVAVMGMGLAGYIMNRKKVNLAFISIGVDYLQVLAMFARSKVAWPPILKQIFQYLSVFNLNIDLAAPECALPNMTYDMKWGAIMGIPIAVFMLFMMVHCIKYTKKRCRRVPTEKRNSHLPQLLGTYFVFYYYLYLFVTRTTLDVFNCSPTDPPDNWPHGYLQVVFEPCNKPGGLHLFLLPFAVLTLIFYVLAYPAFVFWKLKYNVDTVKVDQLLRAEGLGETRATSLPYVYHFRKRFHKLYFHFKPEMWYWILLIIIRKFAIAITSLMFRRTPGFQLAMAFLVIFAAYGLQLKYEPYMSTSERLSVTLTHVKRVEDGVAVHMRLEAVLKDVRAKLKESGTRVSMESIRKLSRKKTEGVLMNHNTVETILLFCSCLICLSGIMFESIKFESVTFAGQRDGLTWGIVVIIATSVLYFFFVFSLEVIDAACPHVLEKYKKAGKKSAIELETDFLAKKKGGDIQSMGEGSSFQYNPLMQTAVSDGLTTSAAEIEKILAETHKSAPPIGPVWMTLRRAIITREKQITTVKDEIRGLKKFVNLEAEKIASAKEATTGANKGVLVLARGGKPTTGGKPARPVGRREFSPVLRRTSTKK